MANPTKIGRFSRKTTTGGVSGFTLIELLVVIVVIAIMAALLLPALAKTKEQARGTACRSNMKQLALAFQMYADESEDLLPWPGPAIQAQVGRALAGNTLNPQYAADWVVTPSEMSSLSFGLASVELPGFGHNAECGSVFPYVTSQPRRDYDPTFKESTLVYRCPSSGRFGEGLRVNYSANAWLDPVVSPFGPTPGKVPAQGVSMASVVDPSRKVLLVNEDPETMVTPAFSPVSLTRKVFLHLNRANVAFMDGHIESVLSKTFEDMRRKENVHIYFNAGR